VNTPGLSERRGRAPRFSLSCHSASTRFRFLLQDDGVVPVFKEDGGNTTVVQDELKNGANSKPNSLYVAAARRAEGTLQAWAMDYN
jgi:hypothetical protein